MCSTGRVFKLWLCMRVCPVHVPCQPCSNSLSSAERPLPAQVFLQRTYEAYHAQEPGARVPPIPTEVVRTPGSAAEHALLCYTDAKFGATEAHVDGIMRAIYEAAVLLEASLPPDSPIRFVQVHCAAPVSGAHFPLHLILMTAPSPYFPCNMHWGSV